MNDVAAALIELEQLSAKTTLTGEEVSRQTELQTLVRKAMDDTTEVEQPERIDRDPPRGVTRAVSPQVRSLSAAVAADGGLVARLLANGRARIEVPVNIRALGSQQADTADPQLTVQPQNLGVISTYGRVVNRIVAALASIPVSGNSVTYTRLSYKADVGSPSTTGNSARKVTELAQKPESILATEQVTEEIATFAHWLPVSKQVLDDVTGLRTLLDLTLIDGLLDKTDAAIFADLVTSGRYTPYTPTGGDFVGDGMARMATSLLQAGASGVRIAVNPTTLLVANLARTTGSGEYMGLPDIPATIVPCATVPVGKLFGWADSGCVWLSREGVSVVAGWQNDDLTNNRITLLCEHRGGSATLNAAHVAYGNATA